LPSNTAGTDAEKINTVLALLAELGYPGVVPEDFGKLRPVDEFETEITVMSEVRGYFEVRRSPNTGASLASIASVHLVCLQGVHSFLPLLNAHPNDSARD
jgi:hypothetical protein